MELISIPQSEYENYRLDAIFGAYKWDPQFVDSNTIAKHALVISEEERAEIDMLTELLDHETVMAERYLNDNMRLSRPLALPWHTRRYMRRMGNYQPGSHIRLMRFDFHPKAEGGWAVSEVNSDVPGGFAEASLLPRIAAAALKDRDFLTVDFGAALAKAILEKAKPGCCVMLVHCTSYSDDRQVMQYLGDKLQGMGAEVIYAAADHLRFDGKAAYSILDGNKRAVGAIFRFTPLEWLKGIKPASRKGYYDTVTPSCNHPVAMFAQTKRFPLVWDCLEQAGVQLRAWRELLPETKEVKDARNDERYIYKPACGRVGEGISIKEACREDEYEKIIKDVRKHPKRYIAQLKFDSLPLISDEGVSYHVCLGSFSLEGKAAGYYARISETPRIDSHAADIPVLIDMGARRSG